MSEVGLGAEVAPIDTSSGLLNADCSVMPVLILTAPIIGRTQFSKLVDAGKAYAAADDFERPRFRLAAGNLGVMAATKKAVGTAQMPVALHVYAASALLSAA